MKGKNAVVIVIVLAVFAIAMFFMMNMLKGLGSKRASEKSSEEINALAASFADKDMMIYMIGDCPEDLRLLGDKLTVMSPEDMNENNMPVKWSGTHFIEYDQWGSKVDEVTHRDYPENMLIILNISRPLTDGEADIISRCAVDNKIPLIIIGKDTIEDFRARVMLVKKNYGSFDSMEFIAGVGGEDMPLSASSVENGGRDLASEIMMFALDLFTTEDGLNGA